ncbi:MULTISPECIES: HDOD domain-containing protein [Arcobacter]|uniref:HDOD domain-containing protein n=1 Tax=Arcobacter ellisii TaxID=913109 RepID=A0A347U4U8_9BACT|nr:HDOD domain-containing protein [Arcobacter ellisii]AXX93876.1 HDOD domain-containing protein [Arcobacter ellisii]MBD3829093.1 HDOD domain-containing protein [Arcobacter sp.]RXI33071.1 HDOD domain-containing protein [Arcobacter ellisii]
MKKKILKEITSLPPLPANIIELDNFRKQDSTDSEKLVEILKKDPLIVANILKIANSSMFGFRSKVDTLSRAINLLGIKFAISVAIGSSISQAVKSNLLAYAVTTDDFILTSSLASNIVNTWVANINFDLKNELLLPAFLQEVGKFVISQVIQEEKKTEEFLKELEETKNTSLCEEKFTGFTCARITANIFKHWNLSHNIIFPIAFAEDIENCPESFKQKAQILQIVKILCDIRYPLSERNIEKALEKVVEYNFDVEHFINSINVIKEVIKNSLNKS